jgi:uncharacterized protein (DUF885 family)
LLSPLFGNPPAYRMQVIREPAFSEVAGGAAHATFASADGKRPGYVYLHLLGTTKNPNALTDLMCHEGVPGHLLQGDIQRRQLGGASFRKGYNYVAFSEGWGLYAEKLCKDMGAYDSIAEDFMRLDAELFRAARLVVDTGIHSQGWTEERAVAYLIDTGRQEPDLARAEVRRYITLPGQATGYKIGMLKIMELRRHAEQALGAKFDIRAFHDMVVSGGSMPLPVLEARVENWISAVP